MKKFRSIESIRNEAEFRDDERKADTARGEFLRALDESDLMVDDNFEAPFIASFLDFTSNRPGDEPRWWTEGRRRSADRMMMKYGNGEHRTSNIEHPTSNVSALDLPSIQGRCDYLVRREGAARQSRCGEPAVIKLRAGLQLCAEHERQRQEGIERLRKFKERQMR